MDLIECLLMVDGVIRQSNYTHVSTYVPSFSLLSTDPLTDTHE